MNSIFKQKVLLWVKNHQEGDTLYKMSDGSEATIYSSIFALFIYDLFNEVAIWNTTLKQKWVNYINSNQDKDTGLYIPKHINIKDIEVDSKSILQLTAFCLSALEILKSSSKYRLSFVKRWVNLDKLKEFLTKKGCFNGMASSGNFAMFLAIFYTYQYNKFRNNRYYKLLKNWFELHNITQNKYTGFWGDFNKGNPYLCFQNALHQFTIYNYWKETIQYYKKIVDYILNLQDINGFFAPYPGGSGCYDFDAADTLLHLGYLQNYRKNNIRKSLLKLRISILENQNMDGGFCESKKVPHSLPEIFLIHNLKYIIFSSDPWIFIYRLKNVMLHAIRRNRIITNHWTRIGLKWDESDMWNTWFKCLTIAEIETVFNLKQKSFSCWNFHNFIGLGYFKK